MRADRSNMELWTKGWSFLKTPLETTLEEMLGRKADFRPVEVPHDWLIYQTQDLYEDGFGWYRKCFTEELTEGGHVFLRFDGVYMDSSVYVNGKHVMDWKYGYTTFEADITDFVQNGENEVILLVRHRSPNSRWYSGAGLFRNVWYKKCGASYLPSDGSYVVIRPCGDERKENHKFTLEVKTEVAGKLTKGLKVAYCLRPDGADGEPVAKNVTEKKGNEAEPAAAKESDAAPCEEWISAVEAEKDEKTGSAFLSAKIENPKLWGIDTPNCYILEVSLKSGRTVLDHQEITVGFKSLAMTNNEGLFLNGKHIKIQGVCQHHDLGCLGSAFHEAALKRQFKILKEMGVNAIRTSHNPTAPEFMELADRMGFLVDCEAFDMWERSKTTYDYARFFKEWAGLDVRSWVRRDRNHPSVFLWSIGNEIYDTHADDHGQEITKRLAGYVHEHDPKGNAKVTIASNYMPWEGARKCADLVKMAGYNYGEKFYEVQHKEHPDWVIYGSETTAVVMSRGIYHFPLSQSLLSEEDEQCSALGNSSTSWGADRTEAALIIERDTPYSLGQFLWSGFDYIGEPTPYHTKNSYFGQIDTAGFPKDQYYFYQSVWGDAEKKPMVHLFPYWDFNPGQMVDVRAVTNAAQVDLLINGRRQGRQIIDHEKGEELAGFWRVPYEPGEILAIAYDKDGKEVARDRRTSFGDSCQICLSADRTELAADEDDLCFITIETLDENGHPVENAVDYVTVKIEGPGRLLGMDNGDSTDFDPYKTDTRKLFSGKLLAVIGTTGEAGSIKVTAEGEGLRKGQVLLEAVASKKKASKAAKTASGVRLTNTAENDEQSYMEDLTGTGAKPTWVPTRKIELSCKDGRVFTKECRELSVTARIYPKNAQPELIWKVVNEAGIEVPVAKCEVISREDDLCEAKITALGDGEFRVRCMAKEPVGRITVISQLELRAENIGMALLDPYSFVTAGLYTRSFGEIGNGNEKGISTSREGECAVCFEHIDFGEYGSDEITIPIFALDSEAYELELWEGMPGDKGSELIDTLHYQKPSIWNVYQEETWKLPRRLKGVTSLAIRMADHKIHIKGFSFAKQEKAYGLIYAAEASRVYGDAFEKKDRCVEGIGNNVTMEFEHMNFGESGSGRITISGWTPLAVNTIHFRFRPDDGSAMQSRMVEFKGTGENRYNEQSFTFDRITGEGRLDLIFLPGCQFNLESFRFQQEE